MPPRRLKSRKCFRGFTLAEMLVSLLIIAEIATFTIPKVIIATQNTRRTAIFKETFTTIQTILNNGRMSGALNAYNDDDTYVLSQVNAVKICPTNSSTQGCWSHTFFGGSTNRPGFILPNGATVQGFAGANNGGNGKWADYFYVDWNGADGPNVQGDDQIEACVSYGTATFDTSPASWGVLRPGEMNGCPSHPTSAAAYAALWQ